MLKVKARRGVIARHEYRLKQLVGEIKECQAQAVKAQQAAVRHALEAGRKLRLAHRLLARLKTKRRKKGLEPPKSWKQWVEDNLGFSVRTAYYYMKLSKNQNEILPELNLPGVSIRSLVRFLSKPLCEEGGEGPPPGGAPGGKGQPLPEYEQFEYEMALQELRDRFRVAVKKWPKIVVLALAKEFNPAFDDHLDAIAAEVEPLAASMLKAQQEEAKKLGQRIAEYQRRRRERRRRNAQRP
jgi:hypothetical protein